MKWLCTRLALAVTLTTAVALPAVADDPKPPKCEPQPTCEFDNLVIKPGAPTPGLKPQDKAVQGIDIQGKEPSEARGTYRLPDSPSGRLR